MFPLFTALRDRGWTVREHCRAFDGLNAKERNQKPFLPDAVAQRYATLPSDVVDFLALIEVCCNREENSWFLSSEDYARTTGPGFRWNEYECMALEGITDASDRAAIVKFWDLHFPFMLAVHSDYDYLAVCLSTNNFGSIVHGYAPEWEEPSQIAPSFSTFLGAFDRAATMSEPEYPFSVFLGG